MLRFEPYADYDRPPNSDGEAAGAYLEYRVTMWPTVRRSGVSVLKQGSLRWAG